MRPRPLLSLLFSLTLGTSAALAQEAVGLEQAFPDLSFSLPVAISPMPGSKDVVFVLEKGDPAPSADDAKSTDKKKKASAYFGGKVQMVSGLGGQQADQDASVSN